MGLQTKLKGEPPLFGGEQKMNAFIAIILGLVQGLCEFLPISSSGHLLLLQKIFGISDGGLFFTVMLHLGTLAAVLVVYRKRIIEMLLHPVKQAKYWIWMIVATLVTAVMALVFKDIIDAANEGSLLGFCFLFTAALLVLCDFIRQKVECKLTVPSMKWYHAVFIGFVQGVAILPGISRSGSTITGATLCSMKKEDAAEFSFLLSIPAILGGAVLEIPGAVSAGAANKLRSQSGKCVRSVLHVADIGKAKKLGKFSEGTSEQFVSENCKPGNCSGQRANVFLSLCAIHFCCLSVKNEAFAPQTYQAIRCRIF